MDIPFRIYNKADAEAAHHFFSNYEIETIISNSQQPVNLLPRELRICRFCGRKGGEHFTNDSHIISELLGRGELISDFECKSCNKVFSKHEMQLANYLGIFRTLTKLKGKNGIPDFPSAGGEVNAKVRPFYNLNNAIHVNAKNGINIDPKTGQTIVEFRKHSYRPLQVFKALVRIGFCMLPKSDVESYRGFIETVLLSNKNDKPLSGHPAFMLLQSQLPRSHDHTFAILFKRKSNLAIPKYEMVLFCRNMMLQLMLPFHSDDIKYYSEFSRLKFPPGHFTDEDFFAEVSTRYVDFSDIELKKEKGEFRFNVDPKNLSNLSMYNPVTKTSMQNQPFPKDIVSVYIVEGSGAVEFPKEDTSD